MHMCCRRPEEEHRAVILHRSGEPSSFKLLPLGGSSWSQIRPEVGTDFRQSSTVSLKHQPLLKGKL